MIKYQKKIIIKNQKMNIKIFKIEGLEGGKEYYMNILATSTTTGEVITYTPIKITASVAIRRLKISLIIFLIIILIVFLYAAFTVYRKYKIKKTELNYNITNIKYYKN